jgi:hypothetical protein
MEAQSQPPDRQPTLVNDSAALLSSTSGLPTNLPTANNSEQLTDAPYRYTQYEQPNSIIHTIMIPRSSTVEIGVSLVDEGLETVVQQAETLGAIAAINAGFFDPNNQQTTSFVTINGAIAADPRENARLVGNPNLEPYLDAILNRSEFRRMVCNGQPMFHIALHHEPLPDPTCILHDAVGAGPQLLPELQSVEEGFVDYGEDGQVIRDAIGSLSPNARSAIGMTEDGTVVFAMVAQRPELSEQTGLSLPDLADFLASIGVQSALNLDGGSSSSLYVDGTAYYGRFDSAGVPIERPVKSIVFVRETPSSF